MRKTPILAMAFTVLAPGMVLAAKPAPIRAPAMQALLDCRAIQDSSQRLACFDKATAALDQAEHSGDLVTIDREQRREVRRQTFGLTLPSLAMFDKGDKTEQTDRIDVEVAEATKDPLGRYLFKLSDGALWRQVEPVEAARAPHAGSKGMVRHGAMGAYFMALDGQPAFRVHREN